MRRAKRTQILAQQFEISQEVMTGKLLPSTHKPVVGNAPKRSALRKFSSGDNTFIYT